MKEERIHEIINSVNASKRAQAPSGVFAKIQHTIAHKKAIEKPGRYWVAVAAVIALVVCSNAYVVADRLLMDEPESQAPPAYALNSSFNLY